MHGKVLSVNDSGLVAYVRMITKKIGRRMHEEYLDASLNPRIVTLQSVAYVVRSTTVPSDSENSTGYYGIIIGALAGAGTGLLFGEIITDVSDNNDRPSSNPYSSIGRGIKNTAAKLFSILVGIVIGGIVGDSLAHPVRWVDQQYDLGDPADNKSVRQSLLR